MSYRGQDLDLRLPPGKQVSARGAYGSPDQPASANGTRYRVKAHRTDRSAPLWVDDTVLAVCNAAHEVAQALHSPEVLLQHLVHGMTRVAGSGSVLESYGVDLEALRRDVTSLISSTAISTPDTMGVPLTSSEFKAALRIAGEAAGRRDGTAIAIGDLLDVLMNYDNEHPGVALLLNHVNGARQETVTPLNASLAGQSYGYSTRSAYRSNADPLQHIAPAPLSNGVYSGARLAPPNVRPLERMFMNDPNDSRHLVSALEAMEERVISRLVTLENNYRDELRGFQNERQALGELVSQLHADVSAHRSETLNLRDGIAEQLKAVERVALLSDGNGDSTGAIMARLQGLERMFEGRLEEATDRSTAIADQMRSIEVALSHQSRETSDVKEAVSTEVKSLAGLLEGGAGEGGVDFEEILEGRLGERLDTIETMLLERAAEAESGGGFTDADMSRLERILSEHHKQISMSMSERERSWTAVNERLNKLEHLMTAQNESTQNAAGDRKRLLEALYERMTEMQKQVLQQAQNAGGAFAGIKTLLTQNKGGGNELLLDVKNSVARISGAQQTTAEVFDQWRLDTSGDFTALRQRLDEIERASARPVAMLDSISNDLRNMQETVVERRRPIEPQGLWDAFSNWLFGPR